MLGGSESRLKPGRVVGVMPAIAVLTGKGGEEKRGEKRERGLHRIGRIMEQGLRIGCVIRVCNISETR